LITWSIHCRCALFSRHFLFIYIYIYIYIYKKLFNFKLSSQYL
jgi:hypothetical protein